MTTPALEALVGRVLDDHYRLDSLLGAGGMGAVYKAEHVRLDKAVAVKILHPDVGADPSISKRFDREATSASRLDHPNCVRVSDFGTTDDGIKYLVMELLEGDELTASTGEPWEPERACEVLAQILAGLEHAHRCGIVHRDLKPENVFVTRDGHGREVAKLVDFGIAKLLDSEGAAEVLTRAGMVFGTPRYMSPEQAAGGKIDERCDLYAVGILAFEMLSGAPPFDSEDLAAILRMQIIEPPPPLPESVPAPLAAWVGALLEKSRHERPESAAAARGQLLEILKDLRERPPTQTDTPAVTDQTMAVVVDATAPTGPRAAESPASDPPLPSKTEAMVGHRVAGRFQLEALLGVGGMGAVFRAHDEQASADAPTHVAVKVLHAALAADEEMASRFEREAKTASALIHPNIVAVLGHGTSPGVGGPAHYLVMPLLEGRELRDLCGAPVELGRAADLTLQLLDALAFAHGQDIVHRDLKPENVFVEQAPDGRELIRLVDFGLAKVAEGGRSYKALTRFGQVFGTPAYMSPEQCQGEVVDARTDVYAIGAMIYELLVGQPPFVADNPLVLLGMQVHQPPPPLPEHLPPGLRQLVADMLAKDRNHRPPDAGSAAVALRTSLETPAMDAPGTSATTLDPNISLSHPAPPTLPSLSAPVAVQPPATRRKLPAWLIGGGGVLALLIVLALIPKGSDEPGEAEAAHAAPAELYTELDRMLSAKDKAALERVRAARDDYPKDAGLMWREGRALALGNSSERTQALHRYVDAVQADPALADETEFAAEVRTLLGDPKLREPAIDVAIRELDDLGHGFLLEVLNDQSRTPDYVERHRILDVLTANPETLARIDMQRQRELDLRQAHDAPAPCTAFDDALDAIAASHDPAHLELLYDEDVQSTLGPGESETLDDCVGLDDRLVMIRDTLAAEHPEAAAEVNKPKKKKSGSGKKKKKFSLPF